MAPAISIYSRRRFSINYYCCSCSPGELKTNKRMTTESDSLGIFKKNSSVFFSSRSRNFSNLMRRWGVGGSTPWRWAACPGAPPRPTPRGAQIIKYTGDKWVINGWEERVQLKRRPAGAGWADRCGPRPRRRRTGHSLPRKAAACNRRRRWGRCGECRARRHAAPETKGRRRRGPGATFRVSAGLSGQMLAAGAGGPARPASSRSAALQPPRCGARSPPAGRGQRAAGSGRGAAGD